MYPRSVTISVTIVTFIISGLLYAVFMSKAKEAKAHKKANLFYLLGASLLFVLVGLSGYFILKEKDKLIYYFNVHQVCIFIFGLVHVFIFKRILPWTRKVAFIWRFLFTINIGFFGIFFLLIAYRIIGYHITSFFILSSVFWLLIPFFFVEAIEKYFEIPDKIYKKWYFPTDKKISEPTDNELESPVIVSFKLKKKEGDPEPTEFRVKAPLKMQYGRLFYFFITDYNDRNPQEAIDFLNDQNEPSVWVFYHKSGNFQSRIYIDPESSIENNRIKENSIIDCIRIDN